MEMKNDFEQHRGELIILCEKAMLGDLTLDDLFFGWPKNLPKTRFVTDLFEDLEEGVIHFPVFVFSRKKDYVVWSHLYESQKIRTDLCLLKSGLCEEDMLFLRKVILDNDIEDEDNIKELIEQRSLKTSPP